MASREEKKVPRRLRRFYRKKKTLEKSFAQQPDLESMKEIAKFEKIVRGEKAEGREKEEGERKGGIGTAGLREVSEPAGGSDVGSRRERARQEIMRERESVESERERQEDISRDIYEEVGRAGSRYGAGQEVEGKDAEGRLRDSTKEKAETEIEKFKRTHNRLPRGREFDDIAGNIYEQVKNEYRQEQPEAVKDRIRHHIRESRVRAGGEGAERNEAPVGVKERPAESVKERVERLRAERREGRGTGEGGRQIVKKDVFESSAVKGMSVEELFGKEKLKPPEFEKEEGEEERKGGIGTVQKGGIGTAGSDRGKKPEGKKAGKAGEGGKGKGEEAGEKEGMGEGKKKKKSELEELEEIASGEGFEEEE